MEGRSLTNKTFEQQSEIIKKVDKQLRQHTRAKQKKTNPTAVIGRDHPGASTDTNRGNDIITNKQTPFF